MRAAIERTAWVVLMLLWVGGAASAQTRPVTLDDLSSLEDFAGQTAPLSFSSNGAHIALVTRTADLEQDKYRYVVHVLDTIAPFHERAVADAGDVILGSIHGRRSGVAIERVALWSPDDASIAYLVGRDVYGELWCVDANGAHARRVSTPGEHVIGFSWSPDGSLHYSVAVSAAALEARLAEAGRFGFHADASFEPIYALAPRIDDASALAAWRVNVRSGQRSATDLSDVEPIPATGVRIVAADARYAGADSPALALEAEDHGAWRRCVSLSCQGELVAAWKRHEDTVVFQRQTGPHGVLSELAVWSLRDDRVRSIRVAEARLSGCAYRPGRFYCLEDAPTQPQRLVAIDERTGALQVLWDPNPTWTALRLPRVERLDTTNPTGEASHAHLVYPLDYVAGRRYPLVLVQYRSRGFLRGGTGGEYPILPLSARGYFVLSIDRPEDMVRARTMSSNALLVAAELDGSEHAMKAVAIEHFLRELETRGLIDPSRMGLTGMSDGAETLFDLLLRSRRHFAAAVTSSPPPDPSAWALFSADFRLQRGEDGAMAPWSEDSAWTRYWQDLSPIYHLDRMRTPILFNLSETETLPAMPLVARLQDLHAPYDLYVYPGAYHNKWRPSQVRAAQTRAIAWLDLWLRDVDTLDPREPERVARWRAMRSAHAP